jgi:hypothetical protein
VVELKLDAACQPLLTWGNVEVSLPASRMADRKAPLCRCLRRRHLRGFALRRAGQWWGVNPHGTMPVGEPAVRAFSALAGFLCAKSLREGFKAGGETIKLSGRARTRVRDITHHFPSKYSAQQKNARIMGSPKASRRIIEGEMSARFDHPGKAIPACQPNVQ